MRRNSTLSTPLAAEGGDPGDGMSIQDEAPAPVVKENPTRPIRGRGRARTRGRGRARTTAPHQEEPQQQEGLATGNVDATNYVAGIAGLNESLTTLFQIAPGMRQLFQGRQEVFDTEAAVTYARIGRITFDGTGDAMDFINVIESRTRTITSDYQKIHMVELSLQSAAQDWFMYTIQPLMHTLSWQEFKVRFMRRFCPPSQQDRYRWELLHIRRGDRSVEEYTSEFYRLSRYADDLMTDQRRMVVLYVTGLGPAYIGLRTEGQTLEGAIEEARDMERRHVMHGTIPDPYADRGASASSSRQSAQIPTFQMGLGESHGIIQSQGRLGRSHRSSHRHGHRGVSRTSRFGPGASSSSSGQSSRHSSSGSGTSTCQNCGRVHQGPCYITPGACFRCGKMGHYARECPTLGFQQIQRFPPHSSGSVAQQIPLFQSSYEGSQPGGSQFVGQQGRGS